MGITLYYIKGINAIDTPYFTTKLAQIQYFNQHIVGTVDDEDYWYPPYLENKIRLSDTDISLATQVNYLAINYQDKDYYYFIEDLKCFPDGQIELTVKMDTIQTYMFDIICNNVLISRKSINRWKSDLQINRDYIREHLTSGDFAKPIYEDNSRSDVLWFSVISTVNLGKENPTQPLYDTHLARPTRIKNYDSTREVGTGFYVYLVPINMKNVNSQIDVRFDSSNTMNFGFTLQTLYKLLGVEGVIGVYPLYNFKPIDMSYSFNSSDVLTLIYTPNDIHLYPTAVEIPTGAQTTESLYLFFYYLITDNVSSEMINLETPNADVFTKNYTRLVTTPFSSKYVPAMIDSSYMRIEYGERASTTGIPLEKIINTGFITGRSAIDLCTGFRSYTLLERNESLDTYRTTLQVKTYEGFVTYNDAWSSWISQHKGTVGELWQWQDDRGFVNVGKGLFMGGAYNNVGVGISQSGAGLIDWFYNWKNNQITRESLITDLQNTPKTVSSGNEFTTDFITKGIDKILVRQYVKDFEHIALAIEKYGYLVNEDYVNIDLFTDLQTRYHYNVLKANDINFDLEVLAPSTTKDDIRNRIINGLRLWNVERNYVEIGNYSYDNVELDYLQ